MGQATLLLAYDTSNNVWMGDGTFRRIVGKRSLDASAHPQWSGEIDWIGNWWGQKAQATLTGTDTPRGLLIPGPWGPELDGILGIDVATLKGPQGDPGAPGAAGPPGADGVTADHTHPVAGETGGAVPV